MVRPRIENGDVFAVPLPDDTFLFGRVMLDVYVATKRRLFREDSPLPGLGKAALVEMYQKISSSPEYEPSDVLIPGVFVEADEIGCRWSIVSNEAVDARTVRFPEALVGRRHPDGDAAFICGEVRLLIPFTTDDLNNVDVWQTRYSAFDWAHVCLHALGRENEIPEKYRNASSLENSDLRFSPHRARVYQHLLIDPDESYYEQQKQLGLNLERLYER